MFHVFCREAEATSNLSAILTAALLVSMFVIRKLGLTLSELDNILSAQPGSGATAVSSEVPLVKEADKKAI